MKTYLVFIIFLLGFTLIIPSRVFISAVDIINPDHLENYNNNNPRFRPILMSNGKQETMLVAFLDGTISLVDISSMEILWSFSSGPPIYSSDQTPLDDHTIIDNENIFGISEGTKSYVHSNFYIDIGVDWNMYMHDIKYGKMKLGTTIGEYINGSPYILDDGRIIAGSKKVKTFEVDGNNGNVVLTVSNLGMDVHGENATLSKLNKRVSITRTDYSVNAFGPHSDKVICNLTVAEMEASLVCKWLGENGSSSEYDKMPLKCSTKAGIPRVRTNSLVEAVQIHSP